VGENASRLTSLRARRRARQRRAIVFTLLLSGTLASSLVLLISLSAVWSLRDDMARAREAAAWPTTPGESVDARAETMHVERSRMVERFLTLTEMEESFERLVPRIRYRYEVNDSTYTGFRLSYDPPSQWPSDVTRRIVRAHPPGPLVEVHVEPDHPTHSSLEVSINRSHRWRLPIVALVGMLLLAFATRRVHASWRALVDS